MQLSRRKPSGLPGRPGGERTPNKSISDERVRHGDPLVERSGAPLARIPRFASSVQRSQKRPTTLHAARTACTRLSNGPSVRSVDRGRGVRWDDEGRGETSERTNEPTHERTNDNNNSNNSSSNNSSNSSSNICNNKNNKQLIQQIDNKSNNNKSIDNNNNNENNNDNNNNTKVLGDPWGTECADDDNASSLCISL